MKYLIALILGLFSTVLFADVPHITPALGCLAGQTCCPISITCSYSQGCGNIEDWQLSGQPQYFQGIQTFKLSTIYAEPTSLGSKTYRVQCFYNSNTLFLNSMKSNTLEGAWQYGFMNKTATCETTVSTSCIGKPVS